MYQPLMLHHSERFALAIVLLILTITAGRASDEPPFEGDPSCPCLFPPVSAGGGRGLEPIAPRDITEDLIRNELGPGVNVSTYGIGCAAHDSSTPHCSTEDDCVGGPNYLPVPVNCDRSWCQRSFCWVNPFNCSLLNRRSLYFTESGRYYSYATCHDMDSFTGQYLLNSLRGRTLKVGFNSNSGGWTGAYSVTGEHFIGGIEKWSGPAVEFAREAALQGGFRMQLTEPPPFLLNESVKLFGDSMFSYCVYATALGYLDMCVSQYSVTDKRASSTDWFLLGNEPLYLIVQTDSDSKSGWQQFLSYVGTIFQPFTIGAWLFIILIVIPVLGLLFVFHEYGRAGSAFPKQEKVLVSEDHETYFVQERHIPMYKHIIHSIYTTLLSVLQQSYGGSAITAGAMYHLLGVAFFILTIIAVYTANLAAILTQQAQGTSVTDFEDALSRGYRFCGERTNVEDLKQIYGVEDSSFVVDPPEEGGDGGPGFTCSNCMSRRRVFDFLDKSKADLGDPRYCHAALAPMQDLEVLQHSGIHCNKTSIGQPIRYIQSGFPVSERVSQETIALLLKLKNEGIYDRELVRSMPASRCRAKAEENTEGSALSVVQLMGIWVVTLLFAVGGIFITVSQPWWDRYIEKRHKDAPIVKEMFGHDQYMKRTRKLERADSFLEENTEFIGGRCVFTGFLDHDNHAMFGTDSAHGGSLRGGSLHGGSDNGLMERGFSFRKRVSGDNSSSDNADKESDFSPEQGSNTMESTTGKDDLSDDGNLSC